MPSAISRGEADAWGDSKSPTTTTAGPGAPSARIAPARVPMPAILGAARWRALGSIGDVGALDSHGRTGSYSVAEPGATNVYEVAVITSFALHTAATEPSTC